MDKKTRDSLLDAGIVPKNAVQQMEQWQQVPEGSADKVGDANAAKVAALRDELELQSLPTLRETVLDVDKIVSNGRQVNLSHGGLVVNGIQAGVDVLKRYIFPIPRTQEEYNTISVMMRPLTRLEDDSLEAPLNQRMITEVSVLYSTVKEGESIPTHWFCVTEAKGEETILKARA
jgi:hypothetical protein